METKVYKVEGMTCNHCKDRIQTHLLRLKDVKNVDVDLLKKEIKVIGENVYDGHVKKIIDGLGYHFIGELELI